MQRTCWRENQVRVKSKVLMCRSCLFWSVMRKKKGRRGRARRGCIFLARNRRCSTTAAWARSSRMHWTRRIVVNQSPPAIRGNLWSGNSTISVKNSQDCNSCRLKKRRGKADTTAENPSSTHTPNKSFPTTLPSIKDTRQCWPRRSERWRRGWQNSGEQLRQPRNKRCARCSGGAK